MLGALGADMCPPPKLRGALYFGALNFGALYFGALKPRNPESLRAI